MATLKDKIENAGIENCIFLVPMTPLHIYFNIIALKSSNDKESIVACKINEERYKVKDKYKLTLKAIDESFGKEHYYLSDLEEMINRGTIEFFTKT